MNKSIQVWKAAAIKVTTRQSSKNNWNHWEKSKTSQTYHYLPVAFWNTIIDFKVETQKYFIRWWWKWWLEINLDGHT